MVKTFFVVSGIVQYKSKILILRKALDDYNFPGRWSFCSGFVKEFEPAEKAVLREINEETGLHAKIVKKAKPFETGTKTKRFVVVCFLCTVNSDNVTLDHENINYKWITVKEMKKFKFVPAAHTDVKLLGLK